MKKLLRESMGRAASEPARDLWPDVLRRIAEDAAPHPRAVPWFDWALVAGLIAFATIFPTAIPVVLYYL